MIKKLNLREIVQGLLGLSVIYVKPSKKKANMKKIVLLSTLALLAVVLSSACSSDDDESVVPPVTKEVNVLLIQSDNGKTSTGVMYKSGEGYNPPHCYISKEIWYNNGTSKTIYHMDFTANIKGSDVFDLLNICFESNEPMSFSDLKVGDTFDNSQFHASAAYTPTWMEAIMKQTTALSGNVTVVGTSKVGDKSLMTLRLSDLRFDAIDHSCIYTVNGIVDYEIWDIQYE